MFFTKRIILGKKINEKWFAIIEELLENRVLIESFRYGFTGVRVPKFVQFFSEIFPKLDERRFKELVRVKRATFNRIIDLIADDEVFQPKSSFGRPPYPVEVQLTVVLFRIGHASVSGSLTALIFGVGEGTIYDFTKRVFKAILNLRSSYLNWPNSIERSNIVKSTQNEFPNCVAYVDGTEIRLSERPLIDPESYFSRKSNYSVKIQITCDFEKKIRHLVAAVPGSVHDARIFKNCQLNLDASLFSGSQFLLGDSAYKLTTTMMTPIRVNNRKDGTLLQKTNYNYTLGKYRIRVEHAIGLLKERFESLKLLSIKIKDEESLDFVSQWVFVCAILHNIARTFESEAEDQHHLADMDLSNSESGEVFNESDEDEHVLTAAERKRQNLMFYFYNKKD